jgi:hypothetical protein
LTFRSFASHEKWTHIPARNSIVTVDGDGQDVTTVRLLHYEGAAETPDAVFDICTADLTGSYRHSGNAWSTMNSNRLKPDERSWFDAPKGLLPQGLNAFRPSGSGPMTMESIDLEAVPLGQKEFDYAYRTAVFARGDYPYILILDDMKQDDEIREYTWNAALPKDLMNPEAHRTEADWAMITDPEDQERRLFVKMLSHKGTGAFALKNVYSRHEKKDTNLVNLVFESQATSQRFCTLIYPHREGDPGPRVESNGSTFTITIANQVDEVHLMTGPQGEPRLEMRRK